MRAPLLALACATAAACVGAPPVSGSGTGPTPLGGGAADAGDVRAAGSGDNGDPNPTLLGARVPYQTWPGQGARSVGLLVTASSPWGRAIDWSRTIHDGRAMAARRTYYYFAGAASAYAVYFESDGRGENFLKSWSVPTPGGNVTYDAAMFGPATPNAWGLGAEAHLVEVDVNGGRRGSGLHFVITGARVLDGSADYPLVVADALGVARSRFDAHIDASAKASADALADAAAAAGPALGAETTTQGEGFYPTWLADEKLLRVIFIRHTARASEAYDPRYPPYRCSKYDNMEPTPTPTPAPPTPGVPQFPGGVVAPCPPPPYNPVVYRQSYAVEIAYEVDFDARGKIVRETRHAPTWRVLQRPGPPVP